MGETKFIIRVEILFGANSKFILSFGNIGVSLSNIGLLYKFSGLSPFTLSILKSPKNFSGLLSLGGRTSPPTTSPVLNPNNLI